MKALIILFITSVFFFSCKKNNTPEPVTEAIHICGYVVNPTANIGYACYWKNGVATPLTSTTAIGSDARAEDMVVYNNDVHIVGTEEQPTGLGVGRYWKNGVMQTIADGATLNSVVCNGIAVSSNGVHIAFNEITAAGKQLPKYWKDGVVTTLMLSGSVPDVSLSDIATSGNDVYILGVQKTSPVLRDAILWKNGSATIIPLANNNSASNFYIAVQNNDVYIVTTTGYVPRLNPHSIISLHLTV